MSDRLNAAGRQLVAKALISSFKNELHEDFYERFVEETGRWVSLHIRMFNVLVTSSSAEAYGYTWDKGY